MRKTLYLKEAKKRLNVLYSISTDPNLSTGITCPTTSPIVSPELKFPGKVYSDLSISAVIYRLCCQFWVLRQVM